MFFLNPHINVLEIHKYMSLKVFAIFIKNIFGCCWRGSIHKCIFCTGNYL